MDLVMKGLSLMGQCPLHNFGARTAPEDKGEGKGMGGRVSPVGSASTHFRQNLLVVAWALKMQDMKMMDQVPRHENAGHENARHENARHENAGHENATHRQFTRCCYKA